MNSVLTFVGKSFAHKGFRFYNQGVHPECPKDCQMYATCQQNLKAQTVYEVIDVFNRELDCPKEFHEEPLVLVKVKPPELTVSMENRNIHVGSITNFTPIGCDIESCPFIEQCQPDGLIIRKGDRVKILNQTEKIQNCSRNKMISVVNIERKLDS